MIRELVFHVKLLLRNGYFVQTALAAPAVFVILRAQAGLPSGLLWADGSIVGIWTATATAVGILGYQRAQGTLEQIVLTPRRLGTALAPIALACTALGAVSVPAAIVTSILFGGWPAPSNPLIVLLGIVLAFVACGATALVLSGLFVITRHALVYEPVLIAPVLLLSGVVIARDEFWTPIRLVGYLFPLTGAVEILHSGIEGNSTLPMLALWFIQVIITSLGLVGIAAWILHVASRRAAQAGTLALS
jgi:ABC-2 type transport system permease protein